MSTSKRLTALFAAALMGVSACGTASAESAPGTGTTTVELEYLAANSSLGKPTVSLKTSNGKVALTWNKQSGADGYKVYYSADGKSYKLVKTTAKLKYSAKAPAKGSYRVRAYAKQDGKTVYGRFSKAVSIGGGLLPNTDKTLTILSWEQNSEIPEIAAAFEEDTGINVELVYCGDNTANARVGYKDYITSGKGDADLIIMESELMGDFISDNKLTAPLSALGLTREDFPNAFEYTLDVGSFRGDLKAVSYIACPGAFLYRADLAEQYLGVDSPEEMGALISSWDDFAETGKLLAEKSDNAVAIQSTYQGMWNAFRCNPTAWVKDGDLDDTKMRDFLDLMRVMKSDKSVRNTAMWDAPWFNSIYDGTALGEFVPTWGLMDSEGSVLSYMANGAFNDSKDGSETRRLAICEGPGGWYWGGTYIGVAKTCNSRSQAKRFLEYTCRNAKSMRKLSGIDSSMFMNNRKVVSAAKPQNSLLENSNYYDVLIKSAEDISYKNGNANDDLIADSAWENMYEILTDDESTIDDWEYNDALLYFGHFVGCSIPLWKG